MMVSTKYMYTSWAWSVFACLKITLITSMIESMVASNFAGHLLLEDRKVKINDNDRFKFCIPDR